MPIAVKEKGRYILKTTVCVESESCALGNEPGGADCADCAFEVACTQYGVVRERPRAKK